jgi:truncated hemoglobin YjbI
VEQQSLYERLGGVNAIAMVVDRFSDAIVENPKLQRNPALAEWNESGQLAGPQVHAKALALPRSRWTLSIHR